VKGRPRGQISGAGLAELARLWRAGEPSGLIAAKLGIAPGYVRQLRKRLGLPERRNGVAHPVIAGPDDERAAIARHLARKGATRCPPAAVAPTTASLPADATASLRARNRALAQAADSEITNSYRVAALNGWKRRKARGR